MSQYKNCVKSLSLGGHGLNIMLAKQNKTKHADFIINSEKKNIKIHSFLDMDYKQLYTDLIWKILALEN